MIPKTLDKYLTEQEFYTHMKFFSYAVEKKELDDGGAGTFSLSDLSLRREENGHIFNRIEMAAKLLEISVAIEKGYKFDEEIEEAIGDAKKKPKKEQEKLLKILGNIKKGKKTKFEDIATVSWIWYEVYTHIRFTPSEYQIPKEIEDILRKEFDRYLDNLINDKLAIDRKNYYKFEAQKRALIQLIEDSKCIELYGNNFILRLKMNERGSYAGHADFALIQTVFALQRLGYLKVVDMWDEYESSSTTVMNVNLVLNETFIEEINSSYKKNNPKNVFEKFDEKRGILKFAGQDIELAKKGKETDAVLLLKTLLKEETSDWKHNDEILSDWGYNDQDQKNVPKNKVYFAGQKINTAVALKTQIEDFVECNTSKARINPKYWKVDE